MKLRRIRITNYKGIEALDCTVGEAGAIVKGKVQSGKTSVVDAIKAALTGEGVDPHCIRDGADKSEILLDWDNASLQQVIRRSGNHGLTTDGFGLGKPRTRVEEVFGYLLDPMEIAKMKPAERRAKVLAMMPAEVTGADLKRWTGDDWKPEPGKHGVDVIAEVREHYYGERKRANAEAKEASRRYDDAQARANGLARPEHVGVVVPPAGEEDAAARAAEAEMRALNRRKLDAEAMEARTKGTRERIEKLRAEHKALLAGAPEVPLPEWERGRAEVAQANADVADLDRRLGLARGVLRLAEERMGALERRQEACDEATGKAARAYDQARDLEATLAETAIAPPTAEETAAAERSLADARAHADLVRAARAAHDALSEAADIADVAADTKAEAERLDRIVTFLAGDAISELAARANMVPGLSFVDDDIALDGHIFGVLSDSQRISLCVELARRLNPKGKLIRVNGLEQFDDDSLEDFVAMATRGGWQLIGTRVERGELRIVAIEPSRVTVVEPEEER
jgi:hypothetical protein